VLTLNTTSTWFIIQALFMLSLGAVNCCKYGRVDRPVEHAVYAEIV
jgi:hypothetical protein